MRKALFRKDLWKDVGDVPKVTSMENMDNTVSMDHIASVMSLDAGISRTPERIHYIHTRRMRFLGLLQIITGAFLYFVSIFLPIFGARHWLTEYVIPMGTVTGPITVLTGIFGRETCRERQKWKIIVYMILCSVGIMVAFAQLVGCIAAYDKEKYGYEHNLISEPIIASFRYMCYTVLIFLCFVVIFYAVFSIVLDLRMLSSCWRKFCNFRWLPETEEEEPKESEIEPEVRHELNVTTV